MILLWSCVFVISLLVLIKSSDYFTRAAERIGIAWGLSSFIVGVTIVAVGTSLPELVTSIIAVLKDSPEIVVGNVVGSNITNILLIFGLLAIVGREIQLTRQVAHIDLPLLMGSAFFLGLTIWDGNFGRGEAFLALLCLIPYFLYTFKMREEVIASLVDEKEKPSNGKDYLILLLSALFVYLGAEYTVESVVQLAEITGFGKEVIAVTAVALGTSLPELAVSLSAARRGQSEMAVGNILGSNIFNTFAIMGIPALIHPLTIPPATISFSFPVMMIATFLYFFTTHEGKISHWEGWMYLIFYLLFLGKLFVLI